MITFIYYLTMLNGGEQIAVTNYPVDDAKEIIYGREVEEPRNKGFHYPLEIGDTIPVTYTDDYIRVEFIKTIE